MKQIFEEQQLKRSQSLADAFIKSARESTLHTIREPSKTSTTKLSESSRHSRLTPTAPQTATSSIESQQSISVQRVQKLQNTARKTRQQFANPATPMEFLPRRAGVIESPEEAWDRRQANYMHLVAKGVSDTSTTTYTPGWKHWLAMCSEYDMDPFLQTPPTLTSRANNTTSRLNFRVAAMLHYIAYLAERSDESKRLQASTIADYCSAVRHFLQTNLVEVEFMNHPILTKAKSAVACRERFETLKGDTKTLAFSADMILFYKREIARSFDPHEQAIVMAMELQFTALNRVSELLPTSSDFYCRAIDIQFGFDIDGNGNISTMTSDKSWSQSIETLRSMTFTIRGSKTDQLRNGVTMFFEIMDESLPTVAFCVVKDAFRWAQQAQPRGQDAFLSYHNRWGLGYEEYNQAIKLTASRMGFDPARYSTHAVRIGGTSALAAAGLPDWQIKKMGRWKSLVFLEYIQTALISMRTAQIAMVDVNTFSINDTRRIHHINA